MPLVRYDHLPDLILPALRRALNQVEWTSLTHAKLAFVYLDSITLPALQRIVGLPKEAAEQEAATYEQRA